MSSLGTLRVAWRRLPPILLIGAIALSGLIAGCSRVSLFYRSADFAIEAYADDYLALERMQLADWRPALAHALSRHRSQELPYLARFFDTARRGAVDGFAPARVDCLLEQFEGLYRRHLRMAAELAAPLLGGLGPDQIRHLRTRFAKDAEDPAGDTPKEVARRERKRAKRYAESLEWWLGSVTKAQRAVIAEVTGAMPDTAVAWEAYRNAKRAGLLALVEGKADEAEIRRYLDDWLVELRDLPSELKQARGDIRGAIRALFMRLDLTLSPEQRGHFAERLGAIRDDFMSLQKRPRMADVQCAAPA